MTDAPTRDAPGPMRSGLSTLAAACLLAAVLGSVHAFSVFLAPLEAVFGASRSAVPGKLTLKPNANRSMPV